MELDGLLLLGLLWLSFNMLDQLDAIGEIIDLAMVGVLDLLDVSDGAIEVVLVIDALPFFRVCFEPPGLIEITGLWGRNRSVATFRPLIQTCFRPILDHTYTDKKYK